MWSSDPQTRAIGISAFLQRGSCIQHRVRRSWQSDDVLLSSGVCLLTCQCCCVDFHSQEHQCGSEAHENKEKHPSTAEWEATATTAAAQVRFCVSNAGLSYMILHYLTWNSNYNSKQLKYGKFLMKLWDIFYCIILWHVFINGRFQTLAVLNCVDICDYLWSNHRNTQYTQGIPQSLWALAISVTRTPDIWEKTEYKYKCTWLIVWGQCSARKWG